MNQKHDTEYVKRAIEFEGFEYAVMNYLNADEIADETLAMLWENAQNAMSTLESYLKANGGWPED